MKKHLIRIITVLSLALICILGIFVCTANAINLDADVVKIYSTSDFKAFSDYVNSGHNMGGQTIKLYSDIGPVYERVSFSTGIFFSGIFDGQGHTIFVDITGDSDYTALFGYLKYGTIKNLIVDGQVKSSKNSYYVGGIVAEMNFESKIINCTNKATVTFGPKSHYIGGVVGYLHNSKVYNCANYGKISGGSYCNGVVGRSWIGSEVRNVFSNPCNPADNTGEGIIYDTYTNNTQDVVTALNANLPEGALPWKMINGVVSIDYSSVKAGTLLSTGNIAIIVAIIAAAAVAFFVIKKKKMTA